MLNQKRWIHIKILHGRDGDWIQCEYEEYEKNYTDNYAFIVDQDTNRGDYFKKVIIEVLDRESEIKNERMEDWVLANILMCQFIACEKSYSCLRILATPDAEQVYMKFKNICGEFNQYQWYWQAPDNFIVEKEGDT